MNMTDKRYWEVGLGMIIEKAPHLSSSNKQGLSCFLDAENLDKIDELSMLVAGCDVLICVLSNVSGLVSLPMRRKALITPPPALQGVFDSEFWKKELAAAVHAGVPVELVLKEGS